MKRADYHKISHRLYNEYDRWKDGITTTQAYCRHLRRAIEAGEATLQCDYTRAQAEARIRHTTQIRREELSKLEQTT